MKWQRPIFNACLDVATDARAPGVVRARSASIASSLPCAHREVVDLEAAFARSLDDPRTARVLSRALLRADAEGARTLVVDATAAAFDRAADDLTSVLVLELLLAAHAARYVREEWVSRAGLHWRRSRKQRPLARLIEAWSRSRDVDASFVADAVREFPEIIQRLAASSSLLVQLVATAPTADAWRALARAKDADEIPIDVYAFGDLDDAICGLRVALDHEPRPAARATLRRWLADLGEDA